MTIETEIKTETEAAVSESAAQSAEVAVVEAVESQTVVDAPSMETPVIEESTAPVEQAQETAVAENQDSIEDAPVETASAEAAPEVTATPDAAKKEESQPSSESDDAANGRVVRTLAVGQEVLGTVKRTSEFGAFIDIGVGRDGLVHVSELSTRRVAKVTDVLKEGTQETFWIKELDRERNRISLTMIKPGTKTVRTMQKGDIITGVVSRIMPYGAFVDIGIGRDALLHVREMGERFVPKPEDVVKVGEEIEARIIEIERRRARVDLSVKGLRPEPEPEMPEATSEEQSAANAQAEAEAELVDKFADTPVMSAIEAAFKRAMGESASEKAEKARRANKASAKARALQEEVLNRTLKSSN